MARPETQFKHALLKEWNGWSEAYEPGLGSGIGYPDIQIMEQSPSHNRILPIELKVCAVKDGIVYPTDVRPSQVVWHYKFHKAGGRSVLLMGQKIAKDVWRGFAVNGVRAQEHTQGYKVSSCFVLEPGKIDEQLSTLLLGMFAGDLK